MSILLVVLVGRAKNRAPAFAPQGQSDNGRTTKAQALCQPKDQRRAATIKGDLLNAKDVTIISLHLKCTGFYFRTVRAACLPVSKSPAHISGTECAFSYGDIAQPDCEEHANNKCRARTCRVARQLWYRTATSHIAANISLYQLYLALIFPLVHLFVY